ncbi:MAG TPA: helix-turn-helix transcriptional regulator, partial [Kofleriaceae bacterium]|nr:helix-turn-helix transcriptional regulator [Kofleriaceae bacterium]
PADAAAMFPSTVCREVRFNANEYALLLPKEVLERSIPKANPPLATYLSEQCEILLRKQHAAAATPVAARVRALLLDGLSGGTSSAKWIGTAPMMSRVAGHLGMSIRTLRRRLLDEGMHFRTLLDNVRAEVSVQHLRSGRMTVSETAYLLGFESLSAFHRAFRRWTKRTPGAFLPGGRSRGSSD